MSSRETVRSVLLLLRFPPEFAGGGIQASRLMEQLSERGVRVTALSAVPEDTPAPHREQAFGGEVVRFSLPGSGLVRDMALGVRAAWWLLLHPRWDLLHISSFSWFALLPMLVAKLRRRKILLKTTLLGDRSAFNPSGGRVGARLLSFYARADVIVALSAALEDELRGRPGMRARLVRIPNGVDTGLFRPAEPSERPALRRAYGLPAEACVIVTCGMLNRRKNVAALLLAAGRAQSRPLCLVVVGPRGPEADYQIEIDEAIEALPPGVEARLQGELPPEELARVLRAADVFALVSRSEGLPNALLEGMASGLACIATRIPGSVDVLGAGGGRLVPLDDLSALSAALDDLAGDTEKRLALGREARAAALERYSFASVADRYRELYASMAPGASA